MTQINLTGLASGENNYTNLFFDIILDNDKVYQWSDNVILENNSSPQEYLNQNIYIYINSIYEQIEEWENVNGLFTRPSDPIFGEEETEVFIPQDEYVRSKGAHTLIKNLPIKHNILFEKIIDNSWTYNELTNRYEQNIELLSFSESLTKCFDVLDVNREKYEIGGFPYNYFGIDVKIFSDRESSQPKLMASRLAVIDGDRLDTDVYKFEKIDDGSIVVVQLSNEKLAEIKSVVYRYIQESYNLQSYLAWQMLGTESTENLKLAIKNNTIDLNPWEI